MTNRERLVALIKPFVADDDSIEGAFADLKINGAEEYNPDQSLKGIKAAAIEILRGDVVIQESEGGYSRAQSEKLKADRINALIGPPTARARYIA